MSDYLLAIGIAILLICVGLSGCNEISNTLNPDLDRFVGKWYYQSGDFLEIGGEITFFSDRTVTMIIGITGNYEIKDGRLVLSFTASGSTLTYDYEYSFSENDMILTLDSTIFEKQ